MLRLERAIVARGGQVVLEPTSLDVAAGTALAVIGRGGAGKSSLLAAAATVLPLHGGDILVDGRSCRREAAAVRRLVGYAPDRLPEWPGLGAREFLDLFATASGLEPARRQRAVEDGLAFAGLSGEPTTPVDTLPSGRAKRLLLARAWLHEPQLLLLDDPCGGLDPAERRDCERSIEDARLLGRVVVAAIDDALVPDCFSHVAVLKEGRLVAHGPAAPAGFPGRRWTHRLVCPTAAEEAAASLRPLGVEPRVEDGDGVTIVTGDATASRAACIAALVARGIAVETAAYEPAWSVQLVTDG